MALRFVGDADEDAAEMTDALLAYVEAGMDVGEGEDRDEARWYSGEDFAFVDRQGGEVVFVVASDPEVGESVASQLVEPTG